MTPVKGETHQYTLAVTVKQTQPDGSDFGHDGNSAASETHDFPSTIYLDVTSSSGKVVGGAYRATLTTSPTPGITYKSNGKTSWSASADYRLTLPKTFSSSDTLSIYPPAAYKRSTGSQDTFRMGPSGDGSWSDDVVSGTTSLGIPVGQLPEVPFAVGLPLLAVGIGTIGWARRRRVNRGSIG